MSRVAPARSPDATLRFRDRLEYFECTNNATRNRDNDLLFTDDRRGVRLVITQTTVNAANTRASTFPTLPIGSQCVTGFVLCCLCIVYRRDRPKYTKV